MTPTVRRIFFALLYLFTASVFAWGTQGHHVVVGLAEARLSPQARDEVNRLLALEPGETLASISTWADERRNPTTAPWHYVNFPVNNCTYDRERDCPNGQCVVGAIEKQSEILKSRVSDERRLLALKYVVHLVADIHQPLHTGYLEDRGGNSYQLQAFMKGSNLHALWDVGLIRNLDEETPVMVKRLLRETLPAIARELNPVAMAEESCRIVGMKGFYPERIVQQDYIDRFTPTMEARLALAGARLAVILNGLFR